MPKPKRWIALLCALALVPGLVSCTPDAPSSGQSIPAAPASTPAVASLPASAAEPESLPEAEPSVAPAGVNVLTGEALPEDALPGQRPVALMVYNTARAWPQRGLGRAEVLVEMPINDGDTAVMAMFSDYRAVESAGPVAPIEDQFAQMALPVQAIPAYIGASQYAANLFTVLGYKTLNGIQLGTTSFVYDYQRTLPRPGGKLHEYSWYTGAENLFAGMEYLDIALTGEMPTLLRFGENAPEDPAAAHEITLTYSGRSATSFTYNAEEGHYYDYFNGQRRTPDGGDSGDTYYHNVIVLSCVVAPKADSAEYLDFDFSGGEGWLFTGGGVQNIKWVKGGPTTPLSLYGQDNREISVNPGRSYIGFVPAALENPLTWNSAAEGS